MGIHVSTKTFGHNLGLSCAFRQWRADSHCHFIHGYAIQVRLVFSATELDHRNWVVDFGGLKTFKKWLEDTFDHKTLVAMDDPHLEYFKQGHAAGILDLVVVPDIGCERFAELAFHRAESWLKENGYHPRVTLESVEIREHGANSALYSRG